MPVRSTTTDVVALSKVNLSGMTMIEKEGVFAVTEKAGPAPGPFTDPERSPLPNP